MDSFYVKHIDEYTDALERLPYERTARGEELNKKIEGLKNYIRDYSLLSEKNAYTISLWEDYLIYSVVFGQNDVIVKEFEKYII